MSRQFFIGMLVGVAVGTAMGMLFAPERGVHTRRRVSSAAISAKDKVAVMAGGVGRKAKDTVGAIKQAM